jgi:hypothetical protein
MPGYKYQVGQTVSFKPARMGLPASRKECTIIRLLPVEGGNRLYRIKCSTEAFERVVRENELAQRSA